MMISQSALLCLEATWHRLLGRPMASEARPFADNFTPRGRSLPETAVDLEARQEPPVNGIAVTVVEYEPGPVRASETSLGEGDPLTPNERRARAAALRAMALSRGRRFNAARAAFVEAARLDPSLDLTRTPRFWKLERAAHEAAIDAYVEAGREGDAAVLRARIRSTYRPKAVRPRPGPALST